MLKVHESKELQHQLPSEKLRLPKKLYLPLSQHTGRPSKACVSIGKEVEEASTIALEDGLISARLHAPQKGKITAIENYWHPVLKRAPAIALECAPEEKRYQIEKDLQHYSKDEILEMIKNSGIVGMGGAAFPSQVKLKPPQKVDTLIINGCECEPYLACDYRLMVENLDEIFKGIEIVCRLINPKEVIFAIEDNKISIKKKLNHIRSLKKFNIPKLGIAVLKTAYPQGGEKQLIFTLTKRRVKGDELPFEVGCLVHNVATCFAIYEAVYLDKPLIERMVTCAGDALCAPKNIWVKIGTTLKELFDEKILEFKIEPKKIIAGGPMMGIGLNHLEYPILKGSGGFLFLTKDVTELEEGPCIRCARCVDECPMQLTPLEYVKRIKKEEYAVLDKFNINDCIECGSCAYVCPAKIPLVHYIKIGKNYMPKKK
ncbi:MAG: electron transport complex subunit RsxC [Candidatus Omnitrophota bacterium]|nr:MAG: electron transport complex subunit RsxC [Candidatus Omnitrophota bacterium]